MRKSLILAVLSMLYIQAHSQILGTEFGKTMQEASVAIESYCIKCDAPLIESKVLGIKVTTQYKKVPLYGILFDDLKVKYGAYENSPYYFDEATFSLFLKDSSEASKKFAQLVVKIEQEYGAGSKVTSSIFDLYYEFGKSPTFNGDYPICSAGLKIEGGSSSIFLTFGDYSFAVWKNILKENGQ